MPTSALEHKLQKSVSPDVRFPSPSSGLLVEEGHDVLLVGGLCCWLALRRKRGARRLSEDDKNHASTQTGKHSVCIMPAAGFAAWTLIAWGVAWGDLFIFCTQQT